MTRRTCAGVAAGSSDQIRRALDDRRDHIRRRLAVERRVCRVSISYSTQPNAQMSVRLSMRLPRACSGLM